MVAFDEIDNIVRSLRPIAHDPVVEFEKFVVVIQWSQLRYSTPDNYQIAFDAVELGNARQNAPTLKG